MEHVQIEWGNLGRSEVLEKGVFKSAKKILAYAPFATNFVVTFQVINPKTSAGPSTQKISMELRLPKHQDIRSHKESHDMHHAIKDAEHAILNQLERKKNS